MQKQHLIHLIWALVAIAAFAFGSKFTGNSEEIAQGGNDQTLSSRSSSSSSPSADASTKASRSRSSRGLASSSDHSDSELSENDIYKLGADYKAAKGPLERREIFSQILANLTAENAKLMREQILHLRNDSDEFREFHYAWGAIAGEEAVLFGATSPERDKSAAFAGWAASSPETALAYFSSLSEKERDNDALKWGAISGLSDIDPSLAVRFAMDRQEAGDRDSRRLMESVTRKVLRNEDAADAANWATGLPAGEMQDAAVTRIAREYADENPSASLDWAKTLPAGNAKNTALWNSYSELAREDPIIAAQQLETMSDSPERDAATYGYASRIARENPQTAIEWASTISDQTTRTRALIDTGRSFFRKDPDAAKQWLPNSGLSPEQQKAITSRRRG